ncbi:MAG: hypothetical protein GXP27_19910 [Planctomycetes bacterium]|nr:hypothetical protein [Planctomycetota bacterium]
MAMPENSPTLSVHQLRKKWLPHKTRLLARKEGHPTHVRFHRACSWLQEAQRLDGESDLDQILIFQWIAFNALYGQWDAERREPLPDRDCWQKFLQRLIELDASGHIVSLLRENRGLVLAIGENAYLNRYFWQAPCTEKAGSTMRKGRKRFQFLYTQKNWRQVLHEVVDRIYLLRCQLVHGAATCGSRMNRKALKHCTMMMGKLVPTFLLVWIDHGADEDWSEMCYPPIG